MNKKFRLTGEEKIAFLGDLHGNLYSALDSINKIAERGVNTIYQMGDFGIGFWKNSEILTINKLLEENNITFYVTLGNHEDYALLESGSITLPSRIIILGRGQAFERHGLKIVSLGGAGSIDKEIRVKDNLGWWPQEAISFRDLDNFKDNIIKKWGDSFEIDIMLTHESPASVTPPFDNVLPPWYASPETIRYCQDQRDMLEDAYKFAKPKFLIHGHHHKYLITKDENSTVISLGSESNRGSILYLDISRGLISIDNS